MSPVGPRTPLGTPKASILEVFGLYFGGFGQLFDCKVWLKFTHGTPQRVVSRMDFESADLRVRRLEYPFDP